MVKNKIHDRQELKSDLVHGAWLMAHSLLWDCKPFTEIEAEMVKDEIEKIILHPSLLVSRDNFVEFCERILLTHKYLKRNESRYLPHPLKWFSPHYEHGYKGTKEWYLDVLNERGLIPVHQFDIKVFAVAFFKFIRFHKGEFYLKGKHALQTHANPDLQQAFDNLILYYQFGK